MNSLGTVSGRSPLTPLPSGKGAGYFLAIGVNSVDPAHYGPGVPVLASAEKDAADWAEFLAVRGYLPWTSGDHVGYILGRFATRERIGLALDSMSSSLQAGDSAVIVFAGHGGQVPDFDGDESSDGLDETWCLPDAQRIDDENFIILGRFRPGVHVAVISDSCHSQSVSRAAETTKGLLVAALDDHAILHALDDIDEPRYRALDPMKSREVFDANKDFYQVIGSSLPKPGLVQADVVTFSACLDTQLALDGPFNGLFTGKVLSALRGGFRGSWRDLRKVVAGTMPASQQPTADFLGKPEALARMAFVP